MASSCVNKLYFCLNGVVWRHLYVTVHICRVRSRNDQFCVKLWYFYSKWRRLASTNCIFSLNGVVRRRLRPKKPVFSRQNKSWAPALRLLMPEWCPESLPPFISFYVRAFQTQVIHIETKQISCYNSILNTQLIAQGSLTITLG